MRSSWSWCRQANASDPLANSTPLKALRRHVQPTWNGNYWPSIMTFYLLYVRCTSLYIDVHHLERNLKMNSQQIMRSEIRLKIPTLFRWRSGNGWSSQGCSFAASLSGRYSSSGRYHAINSRRGKKAKKGFIVQRKRCPTLLLNRLKKKQKALSCCDKEIKQFSAKASC